MKFLLFIGLWVLLGTLAFILSVISAKINHTYMDGKTLFIEFGACMICSPATFVAMIVLLLLSIFFYFIERNEDDL